MKDEKRVVNPIVFEMTKTIGMTLDILGSVHEEELYSIVKATVTPEHFIYILAAMEKRGLIRRTNTLLTWVGVEPREYEVH